MDQLGRYQILGELGRGACGVVYRAHDPKIGRPVAIKTIPTHELREFPDGQALYERLCREAQSAGVLSHPNIVTVYELDDDGKMTYIVMELVEGRTLRELIAGGTLTPQQSIDILLQIASGLDFAHRKGIVHRDVKPANVIVDGTGMVKITDFGVAKMLAAAGTTQTGMTVGTPFYMSPEQIHGRSIDGKADQFALAVIAYEMLAGRRPFQGDTLPSIIHQILNQELPRPEDLEKLGNKGPALGRALAKDPAQRFETCQDFARELKALHEGRRGDQTIAVPTVGKPKRSPVMLAIAAGALALSGFLVYQNWKGGSGQPGAPANPAPVPASQAYTPPSDAAAQPGDAGVRPPVVETKPVPPGSEKARSERVERPKPDTKTAEAKPDARPSIPAAEIPAPAPVAQDPPPLPPAARYTGPPEGRFSWNGILKPGERLVIAGNRSGLGMVAGKGLPPGVKVIAEVQPADLRVVEQPSERNGFRLVISNPSQREIQSVSINWREAGQ